MTTPITASSPFDCGPWATLPVPPARHVQTKIDKAVGGAVKATVLTGTICLIDGPIGIGKTTAVVEAARNLQTEAVYVNMFGTDTTRDQMDAIWRAMTGTPAIGSAATIREDILDTLRRTTMVLLIDDAHHVKFKGLANILNIWNRIHTGRGRGTPIVLCGNDLQGNLRATLPEMLSRAGLTQPVTPLAGKALVEFVLAMEPRIAGTDRETIRNLNMRYFRGEIRRWVQFFELLSLFRGDEDPAPLTDDDIEPILKMLPRSIG